MMAAAFAAKPLNNVAFGQSQKRAGVKQPGRLDSPAQIPYESQLERAFYLKKSSFTPYVNTTFRLHTADSKVVTLTLAEVKGSKQAARISPEATEDAFSLLFSAGRRSTLPQGVYRIEHDSLGELSLLLVPVNRADGKIFFAEAVINHLLP